MQIKQKTVCLFSFITLLVAALAASASAAQPARVLILPFSIHADKDLAYLKKGVADMLASRLTLKDKLVIISRADASLIGAEIPEPVDAAAAAVLGARSRSDYVLFGSLTVFGNSVSTDARFFDVHQQQAVLNFSEVGDTQGEIISHINLLAARIKAEVFGRKTPASRPPAQQSTAKPESDSVSRTHPEKLLDKEAGIKFDDSDDTSSSTEINATLWKTRTFKTEIKGFAIGDVDGDKNNEAVFISSRKIYIYRHANRRFIKIAEIQQEALNTLIGVDVADINENEIAEIFVTSLTDKNHLNSFVLEWNGTEFKNLAKDEKWFYRVIRVTTGGPPILLGQKGGFEQLFSGRIYELRWDGVRYISQDKLRLPDWVNIYGFTYGDVLNSGRNSALAINKNSTLSILDQEGQEEWTSADSYGGSSIYLLSPAEMKAAKKEGRLTDPTALGGIYLEQRIFVSDLDQDKKNEVIVVKNHDVSRGLFRRFRKFINGHFEGLIWDNVGLRRKWKTRKFTGYISDYDISDFDNDGTNELVFAVMAQSDNPIADPKSYIVAWSFKK